MISARRVALLGLDAPLSAVMVAVLGLLPEAGATTQPVTRQRQVFFTSGDAPTIRMERARLRRLHEQDIEDETVCILAAAIL